MTEMKNMVSEMKSIKLDGEYVTVQEYAKAHNIISRGVRARAQRNTLPYPVIKISNTYLIKIK